MLMASKKGVQKPCTDPDQTFHNVTSGQGLVYLHTKNRIYHRSLMQKEKSQPEGKRIMPETRFTKFPALSIDPRAGISRYASEVDV